MRKKGAFLITMGLLLIAAALSLTAYNIWDADRADKAAQSTVQSLRELIPQKGEVRTEPEEETVPANVTEFVGETAPGAQTVPGSVTEPTAQTVPGSVTEPAAQTVSVNVTEPIAQTVAGSMTEPAAQTVPANVTEPAAQTVSGGAAVSGEALTPTVEFVPGNVAVPGTESTPQTHPVPGTETAPRAQTVPGAVRRGVKIKPGAQTAPDIKKGIPDPLGEREMPTVTLGGYRYIGVLDVKSLDLSLPVMEDWDYDRLKVSPCRFAGNLYQDNLVICAHNYPQHFTPLKYAPLGTEVKFTDAEGTEFLYAISSVETIGPNDVEGMVNGDWDLTLFTCNTNGQTRCAIRCDRIN